MLEHMQNSTLGKSVQGKREIAPGTGDFDSQRLHFMLEPMASFSAMMP
jgi:hypothetical protein